LTRVFSPFDAGHQTRVRRFQTPLGRRMCLHRFERFQNGVVALIESVS
jgi:hypothetical protein